MGISWSEFLEMTPAIVEAHKKGFRLQKDEQNAYAYIQGIYVRDALNSTVGNMFKKKGTKAIEYPSEPYALSGGETNTADNDFNDGEMTVAEKKEKTERLFMMLQLQMANFNLGKQVESENTRGE